MLRRLVLGLVGICAVACLEPDSADPEPVVDEPSARRKASRPAWLDDPTALPPGVSLLPAPGGEVHGAAVVLSELEQICPTVRRAFERHVVCSRVEGTPRPGDAAAAIRRGLSRLKATEEERVAGGSVVVLATPDRLAEAYSLVQQEPSFFADVALWVRPEQRRLVGATFISRFGRRGGRGLVLVGVDSDELAPLVNLGQRVGVRVAARSLDSSSERDLRELHRWFSAGSGAGEAAPPPAESGPDR